MTSPVKRDAWDPKGLIGEAYRIDGIGPAECRSIFLDWALSLSDEVAVNDAIRILLSRFEDKEHPMTKVLEEGLTSPARSGRRGGRKGRMVQ